MSAGGPRPKVIVMLGIHPQSELKGGISTVIDLYRDNGLFMRWPIHYVGTMKSGSSARKLLVAAAALSEFLHLLVSGRVGLVHAHSASRASFWRKSMFVLLARAAGVPVIFHLHGAEFRVFYEKEGGAFTRWFIRLVLRSVQRVVVLSKQWRAFIQEIAPAASVDIIPNPISVPATPHDPSQRDPATLLFLGRFGQRKGIFDLLQALVSIKTRFPQIRLRCGGDGEADAVLARSRELGLRDNVELLGWVSGEAKERELARATIYVLPSYAEGLPMGVLEAMAAGVPTVTTTVGGIPDAIDDGVEGYLVSPGDIDALADRIVALLSDVELRARMGAAARAKALDVFSVQKTLAHVEALYRELGAEPRRTPGISDHEAANIAPGA
jgi:glycosyltransferase involved in cell wall biosynthesis